MILEKTTGRKCNPQAPQKLLGHKTAEIYTHVSKTSLTKIKNPLDNLMEELT